MANKRPDVAARWKKHRQMNSLPGLIQQHAIAIKRLEMEENPYLRNGWENLINRLSAKIAAKQAAQNFPVESFGDQANRRVKYPFNRMEIGEKANFSDKKNWTKFTAAAYSYGRKYGFSFSCTWDNYEGIGTVERKG